MKKFGVVLLVVYLCFFVLSGVVAPAPALAQESDSASRISSAESIATQLSDLSVQYRGQLQEYRTAERAAQVAKIQLQQLDTLTALEAAVQATKTAYILRDRVLLTYVTQLRLRLIASLGVPLQLKEAGIARLEEDGLFLEKHLALTEQASTKDELTVLADAFELLAVEIKADAYQNTSLLAFGKVQAAYDKSVALLDYTEQQIANQKLSEVTRAQLNRNLAVIKEISNETKTELTVLADALTQVKTSELDVGYYNQLATKLSSPYGNTSRMLSFVEETARVRE